MEKPAQWALVGAAWFLAVTVAVIGFFAWRMFAASQLSKPGQAPAAVGSEAPLAEGALAVCPVTHESLVVGPQTPSVVYLDRVYYFSTKTDGAGHDAKRRFLMDPEFYVHPGQAAPLDGGPLPTIAASAAPTAAPGAFVPVATELPAGTAVPAVAAAPATAISATPIPGPGKLPSGVPTITLQKIPVNP